VRLRQRRERAQLFQRGNDVVGNDCWCGKRGAAVDDAMADSANRLTAEQADRRFKDDPGCRLMVEVLGAPFLFGELIAVRPFDCQARGDADILDLSAEEQALLVIALIQRELDARRAGIHDGDAVHSRPPQRMADEASARRTATRSWATAQDARRAISSSARLVRMIGTLAPRTIPAASAPARNDRLLASMLPASRSGTTRTLARPATVDTIFLMAAAFMLIALSSASGPSTCAPVIWP